MKISQAITTTSIVEKEITLPYFFKHSMHGVFEKIYKIVDEKTFIEVQLGLFTNIGICPVADYIKNRIAEGEAISELEFENALQDASETIKAAIEKSLEPAA